MASEPPPPPGSEGPGQPGQPAGGPPPSPSQPQPSYQPPPPSYQAPPSPPPAQYQPPGQYAPYQAPGQQFAGFWIRFAALLVDSVVLAVALGIAAGILIGLLGAIGGDAGRSVGVVIWYLLDIAGGIGYFVYSWSADSPFGAGQTLGMKALSIRVIRTDAGSLSLGQSLIRYLGYFVASIVCYIGLIWAAFDRRKQGWHDKIANTFVVHTQ